MNPAIADVLAKIEAAFPARREAGFAPMTNSVQDDEPLLTAAAFADKDDWTQLDGRWLDEAPNGWATALNFLSNEAVCFYIPAYIAADLRGELERVDPIFQLTHGFENYSRDQPIRPGEKETWTDYAGRRWSSLTSEQAYAIVHYLEWRFQTDPTGFNAPFLSKALFSFWYDRVNG